MASRGLFPGAPSKTGELSKTNSRSVEQALSYFTVELWFSAMIFHYRSTRNSSATSVQTKAKSSTLQKNKFVARVNNKFMVVYKSFTSLEKKCSCVISNRT